MKLNYLKLAVNVTIKQKRLILLKMTYASTQYVIRALMIINHIKFCPVVNRTAPSLLILNIYINRTKTQKMNLIQKIK
jgi:hypothetical protein